MGKSFWLTTLGNLQLRDLYTVIIQQAIEFFVFLLQKECSSINFLLHGYDTGFVTDF